MLKTPSHKNRREDDGLSIAPCPQLALFVLQKLHYNYMLDLFKVVKSRIER